MHALDPILLRYPRRDLLQILIAVQDHCGYIHAEAIDYLSSRLQLPRAEIVGMASFYAHLYLQPRGEYRVLFSDNITDRMQGNIALIRRMCSQLGVELGGLAEDGLASIDTTSCIGMCDQGPAMLVNNIAINRLSESRIDAVCELMQSRAPISAWPVSLFSIEDNIQRRDIMLGSSFAPGSALSALLQRGTNDTLQQIRISRLRGRGGAGFSSGDKWALCRDAGGMAVVCNADEGEPGTFKDRVLLNDRADMVFEGMTLCARIIGAKRGFLYLRGEYRYLLPALQTALSRRREQQLLGNNIMGIAGFDFDIDIHLGAGAYICGEESALIESLEGKRGTPRNRPPFPVTHGYRNQPTVVNNVETFAAASLIAVRGGAWYAGIGTAKSSGTKMLSVSGDCERPGIYEYPYGVTIQEVLLDCSAKDVQAVQVSGPSGTCIAPDEFNRRIAFEDLPTAGAFMVFDRTRDMFEVARNFVHFFAHESCGFCTPCRVGTTLLANMMDKLGNGYGSPCDLGEIGKLNTLLQSTSHCGLGHSACNPVLDTMAKFRDAYDRRLAHKDFVPSFDLDRALLQARQLTGRNDANAHLARDHD